MDALVTTGQDLKLALIQSLGEAKSSESESMELSKSVVAMIAQGVNPASPVSDCIKMVTLPSPTLKPFPIKPELPLSSPHLSDNSNLLTSHHPGLEILFDDLNSLDHESLVHNSLDLTSVQQVFKSKSLDSLAPHDGKQFIEELALVEDFLPNESTASGVSWSQSCHCITAETALDHVLNFRTQLLVAFADVGFRGEYRMQVGFNQSALHEGMSVEEISIFLNKDLQVSEDIACTTFAAVFAPFPGVVYAPKQAYFIPVDPPTGNVLRTIQGPVGRTRATAANSGTTGSRAASSSRGVEVNSTPRGHAANNMNEKHQARRGGGSGGPDDDGSGSDSDDSPNGSPKVPSGGLPKGRDKPEVRLLNIGFSSTLSITTEGGTVSHELEIASDVSIKVCLKNLVFIYQVDDILCRSMKIVQQTIICLIRNGLVHGFKLN